LRLLEDKVVELDIVARVRQLENIDGDAVQ
jgi:hypothetical protein